MILCKLLTFHWYTYLHALTAMPQRQLLTHTNTQSNDCAERRHRHWSRHAVRSNPTAQYTFKVLLILGILQFTMFITLRSPHDILNMFDICLTNAIFFLTFEEWNCNHFTFYTMPCVIFLQLWLSVCLFQAIESRFNFAFVCFRICFSLHGMLNEFDTFCLGTPCITTICYLLVASPCKIRFD